jgi:hypothetical protein
VSALRNPNKVNVSDLRDWVRDHGLKEESLCSFLKDEKGLEDDLVAPSLPLEEEDGVNKLVNTVFWRAISTVPYIHQEYQTELMKHLGSPKRFQRISFQIRKRDGTAYWEDDSPSVIKCSTANSDCDPVLCHERILAFIHRYHMDDFVHGSRRISHLG